MRLFLLVTFISVLIIGASYLVEYIRANQRVTAFQDLYHEDTYVLSLSKRDSPFYSRYSLADSSMLLRKSGHFMVYGALTYIIFSLLTQGSLLGKAFTAFAGASLVGLVDEVHQLYLLDRSGRILDVLVNSLGSLSAAIFIVLLAALQRSHR